MRNERCVVCGFVGDLLKHRCVKDGLEYSYSRGIDDPDIRRTLPWWQRIAYWAGCYGRKPEAKS